MPLGHRSSHKRTLARLLRLGIGVDARVSETGSRPRAERQDGEQLRDELGSAEAAESEATRGPHWGAAPALPCPALPCPALPCPALPCPATASRLSSRGEATERPSGEDGTELAHSAAVATAARAAVSGREAAGV